MSRVPPTLGVWLAGALLLVLAHQPWWTVAWQGSGAGTGESPLTGVQSSGGLAQALALVGLAGAASTLVLGRAGRRAVGVLLAVTHACAAALGVLHPTPAPDAVRDALGAAALAGSWESAATVWPWGYAAVGVCGVLASALLVARPVADSSRPVRGTGVQLADSLASWKAMDEGLDPTETEQQ